MDLMHLRCFAAVAEELNFTRAAARVHLEPSPLSRRIRALESELGGRLFVRTNRSVALTPLGERLRPEIAEILRRADGLALLAAEADAIRVGLPPGVHPRARAWTLALLEATAPAPPVQLDIGGTTTLAARVLAGTLDLALVHDAPDGSALAGLPVTVEALGIAIARDDPLADRARLRLADLAGRSYLTSAAHTAPGFLAAVSERLRAAGVVTRPLPPYDLTQVGHMVAGGMGFVLTPLDPGSQLRRLYEIEGVRILPLDEDDLRLTTTLVWSPAHAADRPGLAAVVAAASAATDRPIHV